MFNKTALILVHGSWHAGWCWGLVEPYLQDIGLRTYAIDLPGHGLDATLPASYLARPLNPEKFGTEPAKLASYQADDYANAVLKAVERAQKAGAEKIYLVGHSMGGVPITFAAAKDAAKIDGLIYVAGLAPVGEAPAGKYIALPEQHENSKIGNILLADFAVTGSLRIDSASTDSTYRAATKEALAEDISDDLFNTIMNMLSPDAPASIYGDVPSFGADFGKLPRHYVLCTQDKLLLPSTAEAVIADMDEAWPDNPTNRIDLASSHEVIFSQPQKLAEIIINIIS